MTKTDVALLSITCCGLVFSIYHDFVLAIYRRREFIRGFFRGMKNSDKWEAGDKELQAIIEREYNTDTEAAIAEAEKEAK